MRAFQWIIIISVLVTACGESKEEATAPDTLVVSDVPSVDAMSLCTQTPCIECSDSADCNSQYDGLSQCERAVCIAGFCQRQWEEEDSPCDDGDPCSSGDRCVPDANESLSCQPKQANCDDGNACNGKESCGENGCTLGAALSCDDGDVCNGKETCSPETGCVAGTALSCDDNDACNGQETCDPKTGCQVASPLECDDGNACNGKETCDSATGCVSDSNFSCDDGNPCNGEEECEPSTGCTPGTPKLCDDGDACNGLETCSQEKGCVPGTPVICDDDDLCNGVESCSKSLGCLEGTPLVCDDGNACNGDESCAPESGCQSGEAVVCDDNANNACLGEAICNPGSGECTAAAKNCDDAIPCTSDSCDPESGCVNVASDILCDDGNPCTQDTCNAKTGCQNPAANDIPCDDGNACTVGDTCQEGFCSGGASDSPTCSCKTNDDCSPLSSNKCAGSYSCIDEQCVLNTDSIVKCPTDGSACTTNWQCDSVTGECSGDPLNCDDGDPCTLDSCHLSKGCLNEAILGCAKYTICELTGTQGDELTCIISVSKANSQTPSPTSADMTLFWDNSQLSLENFEEQQCFGDSCFDFDLVNCQEDKCNWAQLQPSGHTIVGGPNDPGKWTGYLNIAMFHAKGDVGLTSSWLDNTGQKISGDATLLTARFKLKTDIQGDAPALVQSGNIGFALATGEPLKWTLATIGEAKVFSVEVQ